MTWVVSCLFNCSCNTMVDSIPQTLTQFLRSSAYVSSEYSTLRAGGTVSLSFTTSSSLEVLAILLWRTGPFITATGFWLLYLLASEQLPTPNWYTPVSGRLRSGRWSLWVSVMISALLKMIGEFTDQLEGAHKKVFLKARLLFRDPKDVGAASIINLQRREAANNVWRFWEPERRRARSLSSVQKASILHSVSWSSHFYLHLIQDRNTIHADFKQNLGGEHEI